MEIRRQGIRAGRSPQLETHLLGTRRLPPTSSGDPRGGSELLSLIRPRHCARPPARLPSSVRSQLARHCARSRERLRQAVSQPAPALPPRLTSGCTETYPNLPSAQRSPHLSRLAHTAPASPGPSLSSSPARLTSILSPMHAAMFPGRRRPGLGRLAVPPRQRSEKPTGLGAHQAALSMPPPLATPPTPPKGTPGTS